MSTIIDQFTAEDPTNKYNAEFKFPFSVEGNFFKTNGSSNDVGQSTNLTNSSLVMIIEQLNFNVTTTTTTTPTKKTTVMTTTTKPFIDEDTVFVESSCGVGPAKTLTIDEQRIVGGTEAVKNSWPGIVSL